MKKSLALFALSFAMLGSVACSTAPKEQPAPAESTVSAEAPAVEESAPVESNSNMSLGTGSSGRGH